jgi:hypothetical protein
MSWRPLRGVVIGACAAVWMTTAAAPAWARKAAPKQPPKQERLEPPEAPPPSFIAPPPGYEPPPPYQPGDPTPPLPPYEDPLPGFFTLDRVDASTRAGLQAGWHNIPSASLSDAFVARLEPYGQFVLPNKAGGFYGHIPFVHRFDFGSGDTSAIGNLELGGFFLPTRKSEFVLRAGIAAGTASDSVAGRAANLESQFERLTDYVLTVPRQTTLRLSGSTVRQWDTIFLRADLGLDVALDKPSDLSNAASVFGRANVAAGVRAAGLDFTLELVNLAAFNGSDANGIANRLRHTVALSVRTPGVDQFHFGLVLPLDEGARGNAWIVSLGYQRAGSF